MTVPTWIQARADKAPTESKRIRALPRSTGEYPQILPGLKPIQSLALHTIREHRGLLGLIGVGHGKTLISLLTGTVLGMPYTDGLILLQSDLVQTFWREVNKWSPLYPITVPRVMTYDELSSQRMANGLAAGLGFVPRYIVLDEAHNVRRSDSARNNRLMDFLYTHPETVLVVLSGTLIRSSVLDLAHLAGHALGAGSPLPRPWIEYGTAQSWGRVLDLDGLADRADYPITERGLGSCRVEDFRIHVHSTPGVVATTESSCKSSLVITTHAPPVSPAMAEAIEVTTKTWAKPNGDQIMDGMQMARTLSQLAMGFYYRWVWPSGIPDFEWLTKRKAWGQQLRAYVTKGIRGRDTEGLVRKALDSGEWERPPVLLVEAYEDWLTVSDRPEPPTVPVWIDEDWIFDTTSSICHPGVPHLIWCQDVAVMDKAREKGCSVIPPGQLPPDNPIYDTWVTVASHGTGKNLQGDEATGATGYYRQVMLWPQSAATSEQQLGRTHRPGQAAHCVYQEVLVSTAAARAAWTRSLQHAKWREEADGPQRLLLATHRGHGK